MKAQTQARTEKWSDIKYDLQQSWKEKANGDLKSIYRFIRKKYGKLQNQSLKKVSGIVKRFETGKIKPTKNGLQLDKQVCMLKDG